MKYENEVILEGPNSQKWKKNNKNIQIFIFGF
jgi:hypothetical protein